ncbi:MAG: protein kinase family protein [Actinomycetospora sp.]|nr:protein kinase family protein [Actinomycetospora sp.]
MALTCTSAVLALVACTVPPARSPDGEGGLFRGPQPWTADVSGAPASERSTAILTTLTEAGGWGNENVLQIDFAMPVLTAGPGTPRTTVTGRDDYCSGGPDCDPVPVEVPVPEGAHIEGSGDLTCDAAHEDCHLLVADPQERRLYELYQATPEGEGLTAGGVFVWDLDRAYTDELRGPQCTSADAAGFPIAALTPTADEVAAERIDHALRFVLPNDRIKAAVYVPPATHAGAPESTHPDAPPYGLNLRLRPDVDVSAYTPPQRVVITALQTYGMYLSDGGEIALTFADDSTSTAKWADLGIAPRTFEGLPVDAFEVIDHGPEVPLTYECTPR